MVIKWAPIIATVAVGVVGCFHGVENDYVNDVANRGVPIMKGDSDAFPVLGDNVCKVLQQGFPASNAVSSLIGDDHMTRPHAEVAVYWAITDLCPEFMSQRQDRWKDGG